MTMAKDMSAAGRWPVFAPAQAAKKREPEPAALQSRPAAPWVGRQDAPVSLQAEELLRLQRLVGNRAVGQRLAPAAGAPSAGTAPIQRLLKWNSETKQHENLADPTTLSDEYIKYHIGGSINDYVYMHILDAGDYPFMDDEILDDDSEGGNPEKETAPQRKFDIVSIKVLPSSGPKEVISEESSWDQDAMFEMGQEKGPKQKDEIIDSPNHKQKPADQFTKADRKGYAWGKDPLTAVNLYGPAEKNNHFAVECIVGDVPVMLDLTSTGFRLIYNATPLAKLAGYKQLSATEGGTLEGKTGKDLLKAFIQIAQNNNYHMQKYDCEAFANELVKKIQAEVEKKSSVIVD
jgi:hypothetical protein